LESRIKLALRLGWILSEVYGRMTQPNIRWCNMFPSPSQYPVSRLFLSTRQPNNGEALYIDLCLLSYTAEKLYSPNNSPGDRFYRDCSLPDSISVFIEQANAVMLEHGHVPVTPSKRIFDDLNQWSRQIWVVMSAEDPKLADAATLGAGLADTYWQWRLQKNNPKTGQRWQRLLSRERMLVMIKRVRQIETTLPNHVGPILRHSIWEWSQSNQIINQNTHEEEEVKKIFKKQLDIWEDLIFDRPIEYYLKYTDRLFVTIATLCSYLILVATLIFIMCLCIYTLFLFLNFSLSFYESLLLKWFSKADSFDDQLKSLTAFIAVLSFMISQFKRAYNLASQLYSNIYKWFLLHKLIQRTFCSWDKENKSIYQVIMNQLWVGNKYT
jgi:hypothetical protein